MIISPAQNTFLSYMRAAMLYETRYRDADSHPFVYISFSEIESRFFPRPIYNLWVEMDYMVKNGWLERTQKVGKTGRKFFLYRTLVKGITDLSLLNIQKVVYGPVLQRMKENVLQVSLPPDAPSTHYFNVFLKYKDELPDLFFTVDSFSKRVHTPITNFHRTHRPNILILGNPTISFDVTTMQPLLLGKILKEQIGNNEFSGWIDSGKDIYIMLQQKANLSTRDEGKKRFFEILFSRPNNSLELLFGASEWIKWVNQYKSQPEKNNPHTIEKEHSNLAWLLQTTEVNMMRKVWRGLVEAQIPFLSVHDEIIVKKSDSCQSEHIFNSILKSHLTYYKLNSKS